MEREPKDLTLEKVKVRNSILSKLKAQKEEDRLGKSRQIEEKLFCLPEFKEAMIIMFYVSTEFEVNTLNMIKEAIRLGKKIAVPVVFENKQKMDISLISDACESEFEIGPYGIKQPKTEHQENISLDKVDLVAVPGLAFDRDGMRLGRGKGYYDRLLSKKSDKTHTVGLAFDFQVVKSLPCGHNDYPVERIISA